MNEQPQDSIFRKESLERLSSPEQLDQLMQIVNPRSWLSLTALGLLVLLGIAWSIFGRIPITATGRGILVHPTDSSSDLVVLTYFERNQGEQIRSGMEVTILPDASSEGGVLGRVKSVSVSPAMTLAAARQAGIHASLNKEAVEVLVELERPSTGGSYRSAMAQGQLAANQAQLAAGVTTTARILLDRKAPIAFAFPFLEASR